MSDSWKLVWHNSFDKYQIRQTQEGSVATVMDNGDEEKALAMAKSDFHARLSALEASDTRAMWTVTLTRADGRQIMREQYGTFPDLSPTPEPEPEPELEPEE